MSIDIKYTQKVIAFLDIMGFKNLVNKSKSNKTCERKIINSLFELKEMEFRPTFGFLESEIQFRKTVTAFSDSIVISYDAISGEAVDAILFDIMNMQIDLTASGLLLRGAVTFGDVFHDGGVVVGPAMVKAYEMESSIAIYPRVIVDPGLIDFAVSSWTKTPNKDIQQQHMMNMLRPSENNYYYIDFLNCQSELGYSYPDFLSKVRNIIDEGLTSTDFKVKSKYEWLEKYYQETTNQRDH